MTEGQSLTEFVLIIAVIILCSIMGLTLLGDNVKAVFESSSNKMSKFDPFNAKGQFLDVKKSNNRPDNNYSENTKHYISNSSVIGNYSVDELSDGSVTFYVKDKEITISEQNLKIIDEVFQSTGSSGELMDIIGYMLEVNADEFKDQVIPVEMNFGTGTRYANQNNNYSVSFQGTASTNTISLQIGKHLILIQKDQNIDLNYRKGQDYQSDKTTIDTLKRSQGLKVIEGEITENNYFEGIVLAEDDPLLNGAKINAKITQTEDGYFLEDKQFNFNKDKTIDSISGQWEFNFKLGNETVLNI